MTRKIHKNQQTRKRNLRRIRTKMWRNRTYKTMKGGERWRIVNLRRELIPSQSSQSSIGKQLNNNMIKLKKKFVEFSSFGFVPVAAPLESSRPDKYGKEFMGQLKTVHDWFQSKQSFIPETHQPDLDNNFVVNFMNIYNRYYNDQSKDVLLIPERFETILKKVLTGEIHKSRFGAKLMFVNDDEYKNLNQSLMFLLKCLNTTLINYAVQLELNKGSNQPSSSQQETTNKYELTTPLANLSKFCETLDRKEMFSTSTSKAVVSMCCFITMPNAVYRGTSTDRQTVEGYDSFSQNFQQWGWFVIPKNVSLPRNTYFHERKGRRLIFLQTPSQEPKTKVEHEQQQRQREPTLLDETNVNLLTYTMSPYISRGAIPETYSENMKNQIRHDDLLTSMEEIISKASQNFKKSMGEKKLKFDREGTIVFVQKATKTNKQTYYELKISKQTINNNVVIVCSLKAISEDGICGSEAIFVTYSPPPTGPTTPPLPGQPEPEPELEDIDITDDVEKVEFKQAIIDQIFIPERRRLERVLTTDVAKYIDKINVDLDTASESGHVTRVYRNTNSVAELPNSAGPRILVRANEDDEKYDGICTLVLQFDSDYNASWAVAAATPIQIAAFQAVNKYITDKSKRWSLDSVKLFHVSNNAQGNANITVSIEVKTLDKDKSLLSVEYQAKASSPYELYKNRAAAGEAIVEKQLNYFWTDQV